MYSIYITSVKVELGHHHHLYGLIQSAQHTQTLLVPVPVETTDALLADVSLIEQLYLSNDSCLLSLTVLDATLRGVVVLVEIQCAVAPECYEHISVLW